IFGRQPHEIAAAVGALVDLALASGAGPNEGPPAVLLLAPPRLGATTERSELWGFGAARAASDRLPRRYAAAAERRGVAFLDASALVSGDPADGVHLNAVSHGILGRAVAEVVRGLL
ncbi:MAG: lipolytic enzyme, G-D-S-L, partial [Chloroflexi bacterium]|nr:lipolytic enzyme, G-D-S-L [Chloroflexota bacterium]